MATQELGNNPRIRRDPGPAPETTTAASRRRRPVVIVAGPGQGKASKAGKTSPGQTKPRLGTTGKPAKPTSSSSQVALAKNQDQDLAGKQCGINMIILTGFGFGFSQFRITHQSHVIQGGDTRPLKVGRTGPVQAAK